MKRQPLTSSRLFREIYESGASSSDTYVALHWKRLTSVQQGCLVGLTVSKRVGTAVVRNLVKRRLRAALQELDRELPAGHGLIIRARPRAAQARFDDLSGSLTRALHRAFPAASLHSSEKQPGSIE